MSEGETLNLFPMDEDSPNVVGIPGAHFGVISHRALRNMVRDGELTWHVNAPPIEDDQFQPASVDLRLGPRAWRVRASFLPGPEATVMERLRSLDDLPEIDLSKGAVFEKGIVYVVELLERVKLTNGLVGYANPKSSTGRLDVFVRLMTDKSVAFDRIERRYDGPLYLEVAPQTFSIIVRQGYRLNQVRFHRGSPSTTNVPVQSTTGQVAGLEHLYESGQLIKANHELLPLRLGGLVPLTVDLRGEATNGVVGYKAKKTTNAIDMGRVAHYDPREFWEQQENTNGRLYLDQNDFYILTTREEVGVPPNLAAEMMPYDYASGEFRAHYAGFFDPGFGWDNVAGGSRAVLEVRSYGVSFLLEHGQIVAWLRYSRLASGPTSQVYGRGLSSHYQGQTIALAKHFKGWLDHRNRPPSTAG